MSAKQKDTRRVITLGGKHNRKIIQSEFHPGQYHDIETGYAKYNQDWENPKVGPPIQAASDKAIKNYFKNKAAESKRLSKEKKGRGTQSSTSRRTIK
jgi:hypothetical protein